jgi:hypothetical protein
VAVFATARKLAQIIYRLVRYGQAFIDIGAKAYEAQFNNRRLKNYTKALKDMGYKVKPLAAVTAQAAYCSFIRAAPLAASVQSDQKRNLTKCNSIF